MKEEEEMFFFDDVCYSQWVSTRSRLCLPRRGQSNSMSMRTYGYPNKAKRQPTFSTAMCNSRQFAERGKKLYTHRRIVKTTPALLKYDFQTSTIIQR